jgi:hypothetical protein
MKHIEYKSLSYEDKLNTKHNYEAACLPCAKDCNPEISEVCSNHESSQTKVPERKFPSERSQAKVPKRNVPSESSQAKDPKRKLPSEMSQAKVIDSLDMVPVAWYKLKSVLVL